MYFSFIRPILEYADIIWDNCFNYEKENVEKIQIEAGRVVTGATKSCSRAKILQETGWDSLEKDATNIEWLLSLKWFIIYLLHTYKA